MLLNETDSGENASFMILRLFLHVADDDRSVLRVATVRARPLSHLDYHSFVWLLILCSILSVRLV